MSGELIPVWVADYVLGDARDGVAKNNSAGEGLSAKIVGDVKVVDVADGKALRFAGNGYLEIAHDKRLLLADAYTLDAWICPKKQPDMGARIIDKVTVGADDGYMLDTCPGNSLRFVTEEGSIGSGAKLQPDAWVHVAATFKTKEELRLYIAGKRVASCPAKKPAGSASFSNIGAFYARLQESGLGDGYEAQHARLLVEYVAAMHARARLKAEGKLPALPEASQIAADKSYLDAANRLMVGLAKTVKSYEKTTAPRKKRVL